MKIQDIHDLAVQMAMTADLRGREAVEKFLSKKQRDYENFSEKEKQDFDLEMLKNPYSDSRILNISEDKEIKKILIGIDIDPAELLMAKEIGNIDLIISHHPLGKALATLHEVMNLQCEVLAKYGVPINIAEGLMREKISEVARGLNKPNSQRTVDAAKLLKSNLICLHTVCDNLAADFLKKIVESKKPETVGELLDIIEKIPEYKLSIKNGIGPKIFVGKKDSHCGRIAFTEITGGTEGSPKLYEKMAQAGVGTIVGMHVSEEHKREAESAHINMVIAGHMASDSLGVNLFLDELEKKGIEIVPCSGLIRVSRNQ
ncbi:Nif3-like dinuclear metal center hexameric protein [Patescibacteria group bacterium]|nr:Nif3-like dinuclear metal center hexameric protein [Patescibacteria group bacterium]MBU4022782.1 Nif3-like dinuclear metal center hexameric protein [Patescibacteria group bacterium]MBU4162019.1 Nif3-like dinuclear metal center hexameric protein [Patescibacteria group bacterium]